MIVKLKNKKARKHFLDSFTSAVEQMGEQIFGKPSHEYILHVLEIQGYYSIPGRNGIYFDPELQEFTYEKKDILRAFHEITKTKEVIYNG